MELASRNNCSIGANRSFVAGLGRCIDRDLTNVPFAVKTAWQQSKTETTKLFDPNKGGRYEVFNERPMKEGIAKYCAYDVVMLPELYKVYEAKLAPPGEKFWKVEVEIETKKRVELAKNPKYV
jgi:exonuclease 3'-5' domain-containing protein 1